MKKETFVNIARNTSVLIPLVLAAACSSSQDAEPVPTKPDFSEYIPLVVGMSDPETYCFGEQRITYHAGEKVDLLDINTGELFQFKVETEGDTAFFSSDKTKYQGAIREGDVFGIMNDREGRGASAVAKLTKVDEDSISIDPIADCKISPQA